MATVTPDPHHHENAFRGFDQSVECVLGADMSLVYGMAVPILVILGLIVILALHPAVWLVAMVVALELAALGVVVNGVVGMLDELEKEDERS